MPPKDYRTPLQTATGVSVVTPGSGPATVGYTNPAFDQQRQFGPKLAEAAKNYPGALQAAREAQMKAYDNSEGIYGEYNERLSQPGKNQMWGRFGAALLQPTSTGSFFEGFGKAANAAMDERDSYNDKEAERMDKLTRSRLALEELHANKPNAQIGMIEDQMKAYKFAGEAGTIQSEIDLGNGPTPKGDDALLADYSANPRKYASARGQAMIQSASERLQQTQEHQRQIELERVKAGLKEKPYAPDAGSRKAIRENDSSNVVLEQSLNNLNRAIELAGEGQSNMGYFAKERAGVAEYLPDWMAPDAVFGSPDQGRNTGELAQIMELEAIKGVGEFLKGPTSDRDVQLMLNTLADPRASPERKQAAIDRVKRQVEAQIAFNKEYNEELQTGEAYGVREGSSAPAGGGSGYLTPEGQINLQALPQSAQDWVQSQLAKGVEEEKIVQILIERIKGAGE